MTISSFSPARLKSALSLKSLFLRFGVLPWLLLIVIVYFGVQQPRFLGSGNLLNVGLESTFLMVVSVGQMLVLITAGMDLSAGATIGLVSIICGLVMNGMVSAGDPVWLAIVVGALAGLGASLLVGIVNAICVSMLDLSAFIATLATMTTITGVSLTLTGGIPVGNFPEAFSNVFSFGTVASIPVPIFCTAILVSLAYFILHHTVLGRYMYALGSNRRAAHLSGIASKKVLFTGYILCALISGFTGLLVMARTGTGAATVGSDYSLQSVAACVIGGVSLFGGSGTVGGVVLGSLFLALLANGMNIMQIQSYEQMTVMGIVLVIALIADRVRLKLLGQR